MLAVLAIYLLSQEHLVCCVVYFCPITLVPRSLGIGVVAWWCSVVSVNEKFVVFTSMPHLFQEPRLDCQAIILPYLNS